MARWSVLFTLLVGCDSETSLDELVKNNVQPNPPLPPAVERTDNIVQVTTPMVDVLWVIDNSCSMEEEQAKLTENFPKFIGYFLDSGLDWHVGVITTDMDNPAHKGKLRSAGGYRFLDENTTDPVTVFSTMARQGTGGASDEKGRAATYTALERSAPFQGDSYNAGFLRDEASLSIVVISDENDYSGGNPVSKPEFISWLKNLKVNEDLVTFSSIVGLQTPCDGREEYGREYVDVTRAVGGIEWSICDREWSTVLDELGMQAAGLKREFFLAEIPDPSSLEVWVDEPPAQGEELGTTYDMCTTPACGDADTLYYEYSPIRNSVKFPNYIPAPLSTIHVKYRILSAFDPREEEFGGDPNDTAAP
jgi:hypothetical protein